ncbi:expressed unknown protein [Seminavis robusta]|uniref:Uncharacterized protein n=1 Tax=Seminavis robusta TaxID=568900 RepID=A0A9N8HMT7_9STRA|nr:expressed unknown protein [Seminavis robusta]|eukprot:Sro927_g221180.1 n/a (334) ;mRNA; f:34492-35493
MDISNARSQAETFLLEAINKEIAGDIKGSKKLLHKVEKADPTLPLSIVARGSHFQESGYPEQAIPCYARACQQWAFGILFGAEDRVEVNTIGWENSVYLILFARVEEVSNNLHGCYPKDYDNNTQHNPNWLLRDGMLKRISKVVLKGLKDYGNQNVTYLMMMCRGILLSAADKRNPPLPRTAEEFQEADALFEHMSKNFDYEDDGISTFKCCMNPLKMPAELTHASALERGESGLWVLIHGLKSKTGKAINGKLGLVFKDGLENGRVSVAVDGIDGEKRIRPKNLWEVCFSEKQVAIISTLEEDQQWKYARASSEVSLSRRCLAQQSRQSTGL